MPIIDPNKEVKVDDREPPDTLTFVKRLYPSAIKKRLDVFDIQYKNVGIELKTWGDLINALTDKKENRFRNQLWNIFETLKHNPDLDGYYFIYGDWSEINEYSDININAILGAVASIQGRTGMKCNIFPNKEYAIFTACLTIQKTFDGKEPTPQTYRILTEDRAKNVIYSSAERLSKTAVDSLCGMFKSPRAIVNATVKQLIKANKVGKVIAERMYNTFNFDFKAKKEFENEIDEELKTESNPNKSTIKISNINNSHSITFNADSLFDIEKDKINDDTEESTYDIEEQREIDNLLEEPTVEPIGVPNADELFGEPTEEIKKIQATKEFIEKEKLQEKLMKEQKLREKQLLNAMKAEDTLDDFDHKKDVIYKAIKLYNGKTRKPCPFNNLQKASKYSEGNLAQIIRDLILESKVYECVDRKYEVYKM